MIIPITRKEQFLESAVAGEPLSAEAVTRIEKFLDKIAGGDVEIPTPVTRIEKYLAAIAGENVSVPEPITRKEMFLAKIAGMDVETPEPVTRIEMILDEWAGGTSGILKTVSGSIIFIADALARPAESLLVGIEPMQDLHGYANPWPAGGGTNKFNEQLTIGLLNSDGTVSESYSRLVSDFIPVVPGETYAFVWPSTYGRGRGAFYDANKDLVQYEGDFPPAIIDINVSIFTVPNGAYYLRFNLTSSYGTTYNHDVSINYPSTDHSYHPYSNICPISGHESVKVWVKPTYDPTANPTATIQLGQTVYGCTLDVTTGVLTVDRAKVDITGNGSVWTKSGSYPGGFYINDVGFNTFYGVHPKQMTPFMCSHAKTATNIAEYQLGTCYCDGNINIRIMPSGSTPTDWDDYLVAQAASGTPVQACVTLATPITIQLTPTEIEMLLGENTLWSENGDITLTYMADGPADDVEALNILLGNRYVNLGEPDEATDREALDILLGGR